MHLDGIYIKLSHRLISIKTHVITKHIGVVADFNRVSNVAQNGTNP